ncbi:MAG: ATP-grasp domain-containing protein [Candidatus Pacebacteria bacterium]|nr:ATP-grasp domain-containing protein [Candidatus Paceibacterota bacterium]MCF7856929.1 ATP-grasp domain-containing protein [Candidatus Paceibacterota bacterium]
MNFALVLDGQLKSALSAVRSLGRAGVSTCVGAERETGMALHSRYTKERFVYPSPYTHQKEFIASIKDEAARLGGKPLVYAFSDATYLSLHMHREVLSEYVTCVFPDLKSVEIAFDKAATYSLAHVSAIPTIATYMPEAVEEVRRLAETLVYPAVIKARRSVTWKDGVGIFGSTTFVHSKEECEKVFQFHKESFGEAPLVQDFILGEEYGVEMLVQKGLVYASVAHHRIRSLSPTGGASVVKEILGECELKTVLEEYSSVLVSRLVWTGPIMVEFKVDSDTREPKLMEINGRFWGSLPLAVASGVDMPYLYYEREYEKKEILKTVSLREDVVTRHFLGDVRHLLRVFFSRDKMRPYLYPKRLTALRNFFTVPNCTVSDVWSWNDLKPVLMEFIDIFNKHILGK